MLALFLTITPTKKKRETKNTTGTKRLTVQTVHLIFVKTLSTFRLSLHWTVGGFIGKATYESVVEAIESFVSRAGLSRKLDVTLVTGVFWFVNRQPHLSPPTVAGIRPEQLIGASVLFQLALCDLLNSCSVQPRSIFFLSVISFCCCCNICVQDYF